MTKAKLDMTEMAGKTSILRSYTHGHTKPRPTNRHGKDLIGMFLALLSLHTRQVINEMAETSVLESVGLYSQNSCKIFWGQKYFCVSMQMSPLRTIHRHKYTNGYKC